jgi:hypothetical protein
MPYGDINDIRANSTCLKSQDGANMAPMSVIRKKASDVHRLNIRLASSTLKAVEDACARRAGTVSLNTWVAEAVAEKLAREELPKKLGVNDA